MEIYENHLGGIYFSNEVRDSADLYCDQCGDSDWHLGHADTWEEVMDMITDDEGYCPYFQDYIEELKVEFMERSTDDNRRSDNPFRM